MSDPSSTLPNAPALTKEQEASMETVEPPPAYTPGPVAYVPGSAQPVVYVPGSDQPVNIVPQQMVAIEPSQFITDYRGFAIVTTVLFAILGPLSLVTGAPAVFAAFKSRKDLKEGRLQAAKYWSLLAAYLSVGTIIIGFVCMTVIILFPTGFRFQINGGP